MNVDQRDPHVGANPAAVPGDAPATQRQIFHRRRGIHHVNDAPFPLRVQHRRMADGVGNTPIRERITAAQRQRAADVGSLESAAGTVDSAGAHPGHFDFVIHHRIIQRHLQSQSTVATVRNPRRAGKLRVAARNILVGPQVGGDAVGARLAVYIGRHARLDTGIYRQAAGIQVMVGRNKMGVARDLPCHIQRAGAGIISRGVVEPQHLRQGCRTADLDADGSGVLGHDGVGEPDGAAGERRQSGAVAAGVIHERGMHQVRHGALDGHRRALGIFEGKSALIVAQHRVD